MRQNARQSVSMRDVAREAGVSVAAVSYAVNNRPGLLGEETRTRILDVARALDYQPNLLMKAVRTQRSEVVGVIVPSFQSTFFPQIISGIESALVGSGYHAVMCQCHSDDALTAETLAMLRQRRVDGLIVTPAPHQHGLYRTIGEAGIATVFIDAHFPDLDIPSIQSDDEFGACLAVRHLIQAGHRRIATVHQPESMLFSGMRARFLGYRRALKKAGIPFDEGLVRIVDPAATVEQGYKAGLDLLRETDATAVFSPSDLGAIGVLRAARERGRSVPDDLAVVGYGNQDSGAYTTPSLTTVDQKPQDIGRLSVARLMTMVDGGKGGEPRHVFVKPDLLVRDSSVRR